MDFDQTQAIYDYEDEEEEQVKEDKTNPKKKEVRLTKDLMLWKSYVLLFIAKHHFIVARLRAGCKRFERGQG